MPTYIALLRGINVSGQKKIKMADLRGCLTALGWDDVRTYIQSGNVVFQAEGVCSKLATQLTAGVQQQFGFDVPVQVLRREDLQRIVAENPFAEVPEDEFHRLLVTFLAAQPAASRLALLDGYQDPDGRFKIAGQAVYLHTPAGYGKSKLSNNFFEAKLKVAATTRNWKTLLKLLELATA